MNTPAIFAFNAAAVRVFTIHDAPWFMATDVAGILGYRDATNMARMLDEDEADTHNVSIRSDTGVVQDRAVTIINESGLYACILKSRRPEAKTFRKWVTSEVLPSIRQHGSYGMAGAAVSRDEPLSLTHRADVQVSADRIFRAMLRSGRSAGLRTTQALRRANQVALEKTGVDMLADLESRDLLAEAEAQPVRDNGVAAFAADWKDGRLPVPYTVCRSMDLFSAYVAWCAETDTPPARITQFSTRLLCALPVLDKFISGVDAGDRLASTRLVAPPGMRNPGARTMAQHLGTECARFANALADWKDAA